MTLVLLALWLQAFEPLYRQAVEMREKQFGPSHVKVAEALTNLGLYLRNEGKPEAAVAPLRRALVIQVTPAALENLASVSGREEGLALYQRSLALKEDAATLEKLATLLEDEPARAEPYARRAVDLKRKTLGPRHGEVGTALNNLGLLVEGKGDRAGAIAIYREALSVVERAYGPRHPETAAVMLNLGGLLADRAMLAQSLHIFEATLGPESEPAQAARDRMRRLGSGARPAR
jgi:tetratricopeptide (TPR) repeat protein